MNASHTSTGDNDAPSIATVRDVDITMTEGHRWDFAEKRRDEIAAYFETQRRANPALWNGRVLLFRDCRIADGVLTATAFETDYASFTAWHHWGRPDDAEVRNLFAAATVLGSDGGYLLGRMAPHTANAGEVYFPCGTPERLDVRQGKIDLAGSAQRELGEETGIDAAELEVAPGWTVVSVGALVAVYRELRAVEPAESLRNRALAHLRRETAPELSDILIARCEDDIVAEMPAFVAGFLRYIFQARRSESTS